MNDSVLLFVFKMLWLEPAHLLLYYLIFKVIFWYLQLILRHKKYVPIG